MTFGVLDVLEPHHHNTSKMAVNFIVVTGQQNAATIEAAFTNQLEFGVMLSGVNGESSYESKILPLYLSDILRRVCLQYATR